MSLSRTHIAWLSVISMITGIIWPGTWMWSQPLSYIMTDIRIIIYLFLFLLILTFLFAGFKMWWWYRASAACILLCIVYILGSTFFGTVSEIQSGIWTHGFWWWWIFLIIGGFLMLISYRYSEKWNEDTLWEVADTLISVIGGFWLACIIGIIILSSISFFTEKNKSPILREIYGSWNILSLSGGITTTRWYKNIEKLIYNRSNDTLSFIWDKGSGKIYEGFANEERFLIALPKGHTPLLREANVLYTINESHEIFSGWVYLTWASQVSSGNAIIISWSGRYKIISDAKIWEFTHSGAIRDPVLSGDATTLVWKERKEWKEKIYIQWNPLDEWSDKIIRMDLSPNGRNIMSIVEQSGSLSVVENGKTVYIFSTWWDLGTYTSNGSHFLWVQKKNGLNHVIYDGKTVWRDLEEVRELFLEKDGWSYAYFGRPLGEEKYCLYTRYKWNLCGLAGYMDPRLGADGWSVLFAGYQDGKWGIYRNADLIVRETGYTSTNNSRDFAFYDPTNPRTFLFVVRDQKSGTYSYIKNGKPLPNTWLDVSTEVSYGYDNHIITSAKDTDGWKVIEL